jgi:hypothetical protein
MEDDWSVPETFQNLQLVFKYVQNTYLKIRKIAPENIKQNFRDWMEVADGILNPDPVPGIGPVPGENIESPEEAMAMAQATGQLPPGQVMPGM